VLQALSQNKSLSSLCIKCRGNDVDHPRLTHFSVAVSDLPNNGLDNKPIVQMVRRLLETNRNVLSVGISSCHYRFRLLEFRNRVHRLEKVQKPSVWPLMLYRVKASLAHAFLKNTLAWIINEQSKKNTRKRTLDDM